MGVTRVRQEFVKITVNFETREDGGLRAWSDDVPGFVLSHSDCEALMADVQPALEVILSARFDTPVHVEKLLEASAVLQPVADPCLPPTRREYVSQRAA